MNAATIEQVALSKTTVHTLPPWADGLESTSSTALDTSSPTSTTISAGNASSRGAASSPHKSTPSLSSNPSHLSHTQQWSQFTTMSHISTISERVSRKLDASSDATALLQETETDTPPASRFRRLPQRLDKIFGAGNSSARALASGASSSNSIGPLPSTTCSCDCNCPEHQKTSSRNRQSWWGGESSSTLLSRKQTAKREREASLGYPTGVAVSSLTAPPVTDWDQWEDEKPEEIKGLSSYFTNEAFNMDTIKLLLSSPLFSNFLKILTVMAAVSLFAIALDAIILLQRASDDEKTLTQLWNDSAALVITTVFSLLTVLYSCLNIYLESRRSPEGLDEGRRESKPLFIIFSEILASIAWAQVLSVTIYIYIWTFGCTEAGERQLQKLWKQNLDVDRRLNDRMCRRQGAMVGLELLLILLLIFNFYTHLSQNFQFIRSVSR